MAIRGREASKACVTTQSVRDDAKRRHEVVDLAYCPASPISPVCLPETEIHPFGQQLLLSRVASTTSIRPPFPADGPLLRLPR